MEYGLKDKENIYIPLSGEKSFKKDLLPIIIKDNKLTWLKGLPTGIVINCENINDLIFELETLRKNLILSNEMPERIFDFFDKRLEAIIEKLEESSQREDFEEGFLG